MSNILPFKKVKITKHTLNQKKLHDVILFGGIHSDMKHVLDILEHDEDIDEAISFLKYAITNIENIICDIKDGN
ncbi:TPA: hypothetical protein U2K06_002809 [Legionella pneumophila]|nr:hypothetical protein [Legionella pneumophila]